MRGLYDKELYTRGFEHKGLARYRNPISKEIGLFLLTHLSFNISLKRKSVVVIYHYWFTLYSICDILVVASLTPHYHARLPKIWGKYSDGSCCCLVLGVTESSVW